MFKKWFDASYKEYKRCVKIAEEVDKKAEEYRKKTDEELKAMTPYFKEQLAKGASLDDIMVDAFGQLFFKV
nr:hypothetical protein [Bacilli bacterium]